jgi:ubiquinone/menaquinone biosynthesis C-methylase UbiE
MKVLDVGCGWGRLSIGLLRRLPKLKIVGIDISEVGIKQATDVVKGECGEVDFEGFVTSADDLPFGNGTFDAVVSSRVFQYLSDPQAAFDEVFRVLRPGGRATVMVPNKKNPWHILRYHTKLMTVRELDDMAKRSGLQTEATGTLLFFPPRVFRFDEDSIVVKIERMLSRIPIVNKVGGLAMVCVSKPEDC